MNAPVSSIDPAEVERFARIADAWWDPRGKFAPLHRFNPVRLAFVRDQALAALGGSGGPRPFAGLRLLDVGCGGGLVAEPMARLGFAVTGLDAAERNIAAARAHAERSGLEIDYRAGTVEGLIAGAEPPFDVVLTLEVVEHVADPAAFLADALRLVRPGGLLVAATLNRTLRALALAKIGAEYVLGWLPRGAHDWRKFLRPQELRALLEAAGGVVEGPFGVSYDPLRDLWSQSSDASINYMMTARRPA